jgi:uncharacterized caspase-like protein
MDARTRLRMLALLLLSLSWFADAGRTQATGSRWALLVGVADYDDENVSDLQFTVNDVKAVGASLVKYAGFTPGNVLTMTSDLDPNNPNRPTHVNLINRLNTLSSRMNPDDTFVFYFSGHGFGRPQGHFLGTVNADTSSVESLEATTVSVATLQRLVSKVQARQVVFIIDACRNDPEKAKGGEDNRLNRNFTRDLQVAARAAAGGGAGWAVLLACSEGERAYEWTEKGQGVFTYFLLEALAGKGADQGQLTVASIAEFVHAQVREWGVRNNKTQRPDCYQQGAAKIVLAQVESPGAPVEVISTTARFRVNSQPPHARIYVDERDTGKITPAEVEVELGVTKRKQVEVGLVHDQYKTAVRQAIAERGQVVLLEVEMEPKGERPKVQEPVDPNNLPIEMISAARKRALVIGIQNYPRIAPHLGGTADAAAVASFLRTRWAFSEDNIDVVLDGPGGKENQPSQVNLKRHMDNFFRGLAKQSVAFLYFSGHIVRLDNEEYLVPWGANPERAKSSCMRLREICEVLAERKTNKALVFIEGTRLARGELFVPKQIYTDFRLKVGETKPREGFICSTSADEQSQSVKAGAAEQGVFTRVLLDVLNGDPEAGDGRGWVTMDSLYKVLKNRVFNHVQSRNGTSQTPYGLGLADKMIITRIRQESCP